MRKILTLFLLIPLLSCEEKVSLPDGFEQVSKDGKAHFLYVEEKYRGERVIQREAGRTICTKLFQEQSYCEVYFFGNREEIPLKFPIMNRIHPIGIYRVRDGKEIFKSLSDHEGND